MNNEKFQELILEKLTKLEEGQAKLEAKIDKITEQQQQDIIAVLKIMTTKMTTKDDIDRIAQDVNFLVRKAAEHDNDIRQIRRAQQ